MGNSISERGDHGCGGMIGEEFRTTGGNKMRSGYV